MPVSIAGDGSICADIFVGWSCRAVPVSKYAFCIVEAMVHVTHKRVEGRVIVSAGVARSDGSIVGDEVDEWFFAMINDTLWHTKEMRVVPYHQTI
jgi:hypothetical protein